MTKVKEIRILISEEDHEELLKLKKGRTWKDVLIDGANTDPNTIGDRRIGRG